MTSLSARKFIILQEDDKGFSFGNKKATGYTKIEEKDLKYRICYFAQNLDKNNSYILALILKKDDKIEILSIGDCKVDSNGKIDVCYELDESILENICGSTILVKDQKGTIKYALSGFLPKKRILNWKSMNYRGIKNKLFRKESTVNEKKRDVKAIKKQDHIEFEEQDINDEKIQNQVNCDNIGDNEVDMDYLVSRRSSLDLMRSKAIESQDLEQEENKEEESIKYSDVEVEEDFDNEIRYNNSSFLRLRNEAILRECKESGSSNNESKNNLYEKHEKHIKKVFDKSKDCYEEAKHHIEELKKLIIDDNCEKIVKLIKSIIPKESNRSIEIPNDYDYRFFLNILSEFKEIKSLREDGYRFFKVEIDDFEDMTACRKKDKEKYVVIYYPMISLYPYLEGDKHFLVGIHYDESKNISNLVYGVPAKQGREDDLPYDGKIGFVDYIYNSEEFRGYHIMEYDYKNLCVK